jgi:hypothetical protein
MHRGARGTAKQLDATARMQRETLSLMNKLSHANARAIWDKISRYVTDETCDRVVPGVLDSVVSNMMYASVIVDFMGRFDARGVGVRPHVVSYVTGVKAQVEDDAYMRALSEQVDCNKDYDRFCAVQKRKKELAARVAFCLMLDRTFEWVREVVAALAAALKDRLREYAASALTADALNTVYELAMSTGALPMQALYRDLGLEGKLSNRNRLLTTTAGRR